MAVSIKEVRTKRELRQFAKFPNVLYKNNKYYVPQLISMDMATFSPKKNRAFEVCEGKYWLAYKDGELVGRVAGIINHKYNRKVDCKNLKIYLKLPDSYVLLSIPLYLSLFSISLPHFPQIINSKRIFPRQIAHVFFTKRPVFHAIGFHHIGISVDVCAD